MHRKDEVIDIQKGKEENNIQKGVNRAQKWENNGHDHEDDHKGGK